MNLFAKYNRILLLALVTGLLAVGILFYQALNYTLNGKIEENLHEELTEVKDYTHVKNIVPAPSEDLNLVIEYSPAKTISNKKTIGDTTFYNPRKRQTEYARYLKADVEINGKPTHVLIFNSKDAQTRRVQLIFWAIIIPVIILCGLLALLNRYLLLKLWLPFHQILNQIKGFNIKRGNYQAINTDINEFKQLNDAVRQMTV